MNNFQSITRTEITSLHGRISYIEGFLEKISMSFENSNNINEIIEPSKMEVSERKKAANKSYKTWEKIQSLINDGDINGAYKLVLSKDNNKMLIRIMKKTGMVIEKLENFTIETLVKRMSNMISLGEFMETILKWLGSIDNLQLAISEKGRALLEDSINELLKSEERMKLLTEEQINEINRIINSFKSGHNAPYD